MSRRGQGWRLRGGRLVVGLVLAAIACAPGTVAPATKPAPAPGQPPAAQPPAAAQVQPPAPTAAPAPVQLKYGTQRPVTDAAIFIADAKGYFKEAGVEMDFVDFGSATEMLPALATGQLDMGGTTPVAAVVNAIARGVDVKTVAERGANVLGFGYTALMLRKDLIDSGRVKDYPDLRGLQFGVGAPLKAAGGSTELLAVLEKGGLEWDDVNATALSFPDMDAALANGALDAIIVAEPWASHEVAAGYGVRWKGMDEVYPNHMLAGLAYSPVMTRDRPDVARNWMVAYVRGVRWYLDAVTKGQGKDELYSIIAQYSTMKDRAVLERMTLHGVKPDPYVDRASVVRDLAAYRRWGTVTEQVDIEQLIDDQWVRYAVEKLGPYR